MAKLGAAFNSRRASERTSEETPEMPDTPIEPREHYVYALYREDGVTPFYIGMGKGRRWTQHITNHKSEPYRGPKWYIIDRMLRKDLTIPRAKLAEHLTVAEAIALEVRLIAEIGRMPSGPLANMTDGGEGVTGMTPAQFAARAAKIHAKVNTPERIAKFAEWARRPRGKPSPETIAKAQATRARNGHRRSWLSEETQAKWMAGFRDRLPAMQAAVRARLNNPPPGDTERRSAIAKAFYAERKAEILAKRSATIAAKKAQKTLPPQDMLPKPQL
jgi:hypothetical protein